MNVHDTDNDATEPTTHVEPPVAVNVTDPPVSPTVAFTVGVLTFVTRSELLVPESLVESSARAAGAVGAAVSYVIASEVLAEFPLPAASVNAPPATDNDAVPDAFAVGVKVAVNTVADVEANPDNDPPDTETSPTTKSADDSDRVNVTVDV